MIFLPGIIQSSSGRQGGGIQPIDNVNITCSNAQYTNRPISITSTTTGTVIQWLWVIKNTLSGVVVGISLEKNPVFSITTEGYYDLYLYANNSTDYYTARYRRAFRVFKPKLTDVEILANGGSIVDLSTSDVLYYDYTGVDMSDKVIRIKNSSSNVLLQFHNLTGTPGHPVIIDKGDDNIKSSTTCRAGSSHCFWLSGTASTGCRYITVNGFNQDGTCGMRFSGNSTSGQVFFCDGKFTDIELCGIEFTHLTTIDAAAVAMQPTVGASNNIDIWYCDSLICYRLDITNAGEEGIYILESNQSPGYIGNNGFYPPSGRNGVIAWCNVINCGRDAYQWGCWLGYEVHNNYGTNWGIQADGGGQEAGFAHNSGSAGAVFENTMIGGKYFYSVSSGLIPWDKRAGETTPRPSMVINNVFSKGSYSQHGGVEPFCFYTQNAPASGSGVWNMYVISNVFDTDKKMLQATWAAGGFHGTDWKFVNNIIIKNGSAAGAWPELEFTGNDVSSTTGTVVNNLVREMGSDLSSLRFTDYANYNYKPTSTTSIAYSGSPTNIDSYTQYANYIYDIENFPSKLPSVGYYFGPYSLYGKRLVTPPSPIDPVFPVYTLGPIISPTETGGSITSTTNKLSVNYFSILANGASAPSYNQIINGTSSLAHGNYMDSGSGGSDLFTGLTQATAYDYYYFSSNSSGIRSSITKIDFNTATDVTAPVLTGWNIPDNNRSRIYFNSSEIITGTTFSGFTVSGKTITAISINSGQLTGHYFTVNTPFAYGDTSNLAYSGSGSNIKDLANNSLAAISSTAVSSSILPAVETPVVGTNATNITISGTSSNTFTSTTTSATIRSSQIIPSTSDGYIKWDWNTATRSGASTVRIGLIAATDTQIGANVKAFLDLQAANHNIDIYEGNTYKSTFNTFGYNQANIRYRMKIRRSDAKIVIDATTNNFSSVVNVYTSTTTFTGDMRFVFVATATAKMAVNTIIQADKGLI